MTSWTMFLIWMIEAAHRSQVYLTSTQIDNMKLNSLLLPNDNSFQANNGISVNMAEVTSIGKSDDASSDPFALGYWILKSFLYFHFISFWNFLYFNYSWSYLLNCLPLNLHFFFSSKKPSPDMDTKTFSARIIHASNYLEFLNRKIIEHIAWPHQKPTKANSYSSPQR